MSADDHLWSLPAIRRNTRNWSGRHLKVNVLHVNKNSTKWQHLRQHTLAFNWHITLCNLNENRCSTMPMFKSTQLDHRVEYQRFPGNAGGLCINFFSTRWPWSHGLLTDLIMITDLPKIYHRTSAVCLPTTWIASQRAINLTCSQLSDNSIS